MVIKQAPHQLQPDVLKKNIQEFWRENKIYEKTRKKRAGGRDFYFLDGPPYTTGAIHLGTAWNKIIKDSIVRFLRMQGYNVRDQAGWDMHGLPIEVKVEKELGIKTKKAIDKIGVDKFVSRCREFALRHMDQMTEQFRQLGVWLDWDKPYMTIKNEYMEAVWWVLKKAEKAGLLYEDVSVVEWCPRCETALASNYEIEYEEVEDYSIFLKIPLEKKNTFIVVWTTTPWTLPADLAVSVHPDQEYVTVKVDDEYLILAAALAPAVLGALDIRDYEIIEKRLGRELEGLKYNHPLLTEVPIHQRLTEEKNIHTVVLSDTVTLTEGTGCVHTAPGHGPEDFKIGQAYGIPPFCPVDERGILTMDAGKYSGMYVKDADEPIISDLKKKGLLLRDEKILHRYGHCWRCKTPIVLRATKQWFLKASELREQMLKEIDEIAWVPDWAGTSRFRNWVENVRDWCISRQRYWGIPLPIWICEKCKKRIVLGSMKGLKDRAIKKAEKLELHRPWIDKVVLRCDCGGKMFRVKDVLDVWLDSGAASWASLRFPHETGEFERWWPADFITEGHDQTRGWFYSQLGAGIIGFDRSPYEKVLMHGFALDKDGRKMSKSLGNIVGPEEIIDRYGVDTLRFYLLWAIAPWDDLRFNWDEVEVVDKMLNVLWHVQFFASTYMELDEFDPTQHEIGELQEHLLPEDQWLLSRTNSLILDVSSFLKELELNKATRTIYDFVLNDLSRWYIRLVRRRTWIEKEDPLKISAYLVLYKALEALSYLLAPITPYLAEDIYQRFVRAVNEKAPESVHMCNWPRPDKDLVDASLEENMETVRDIASAAAKVRQTAGLKLRWPLQKLIIESADPATSTAVEKLKNVIKTQTNVKNIEVLPVKEKFPELKLCAEPDLSKLGPKYRKDADAIAKHIRSLDGEKIKAAIDRQGYFEFEFKDKSLRINEDEVRFQEKLPEKYGGSGFSGGKIYLDIELTPDLWSEAISQEVVRRIQQMRKELDLNVEDMIHAYVSIPKKVEAEPQKHKDYISTEVRAEKLVFHSGEVKIPKKAYRKTWEIDGEKYEIAILKVEVKPRN